MAEQGKFSVPSEPTSMDAVAAASELETRAATFT